MCVVSFKDSEGFRHAVEVVAESLYEAVAIAARNFADAGCPPTSGTQMDIEVRAPAVTHTITLMELSRFLRQLVKAQFSSNGELCHGIGS